MLTGNPSLIRQNPIKKHLYFEIKTKADKKERISTNVTLINLVMCMLCNCFCVWQSGTVNDSTCGFMSCLSSLLPTMICSRDNQVEKHTGPLPHPSDGSNDKIEVYRNHFTALPKELKHIQIKEEM